MRNIVGQTKSAFDIGEIMNHEKLLLVSLSKGIIGDLNSTLLGLILVSKIQIAALRRQSMAKEDRKDFFLYIDEFQNYVTDSIESILSETSGKQRSRLERLQWRIDMERRRAATPLSACARISKMMMDAVYGETGLVSAIKGKVNPDSAPAAKVIEITRPLRHEP